ncbi:MAG: glycoside hydrolase family 3 C-terminal domain-containing protein [Lachnospiraceae bacterium]|nr:glycoside hydrolase family 3 C-terminal domain-containing protein [Lachnospiraceae bacterium]
MSETKVSKKALKKAYKKTKRKTVTPWKVLTLISGPVAVIMAVATFALSMFDNTLAAFVGGDFHELVNKDANAIYYESDFASPEEMVEYGLELCELVEAEGAALLMNENNALPLAKGSKVSCFSNSSVNLVYGGTGSGNIDASTANTLKDALENSGFEVNETLWNFYAVDAAEYLRKVGGVVTTTAATTSECPWGVYTNNVVDSVKGYGDAAIVTFSRVGGEGADLEFDAVNYLALDENEKEMMENVKAMKDAGTIKKIIVLINSANPLQVDFLKDNEYGVDACLWIGDVGISGIDAVAEILAGNVVPSGSLVDTYCYDNYSSPAMANFVPTTYEGYKEGMIPANASTYMIYQEGIYVGYKYYETRYEDYVMGTGNAGDYVYEDVVAFPFGYGLSYTDFKYSDMKVKYNKSTDQFEVTLKVTNTGKEYSGKETVQIYVQSPYTAYDVENGVEKASVALCGFGKTGIIAPGKSENITVYVDKRDLASYDTYGAGTYILDAGDYFLIAATDAHDAVNNVLAAKGYTSANTKGRMDGKGNADLVYKWTNDKFDATTYAASLNGTEITNQLSNADINLYDGVNEEITYLSRNDWTGTWPTEILKITLTEKLIAALQDVQYDATDYEAVEMPTLGADNGLKLVDMIGKDFNDPAWQDLLDQMTFEEMVSLIGDSFYWTMPIESVQAPATRDENGPQGLTASLFSGGVSLEATAFTSEDVMAATFNTDIMTEIGRVMGNNCLEAGIACLYGPGNNTHRTPYGGRNFEYYSEDGFLAGEMSKYQVAAMADAGVFVVMKHFALNDSEQDRIGLGVWINEQAAREIYLKAFQAPIEEADAGVMTAYTRWGATWSGSNKGLMTNIMREEWGKVGLNITDNVLTTYVNGVDGVMAGGVSTYDAMLWYVTSQLPEYENDPVVVTAMREACHHNLYSIANSNGMNGMGPDTTIKITELKLITICKTVAIVFGVLFVAGVVMWILGKRKFKKTEAYQEYKAYKAAKKAVK